jgi:hypothetical protein
MSELTGVGVFTSHLLGPQPNLLGPQEVKPKQPITIRIIFFIF